MKKVTYNKRTLVNVPTDQQQDDAVAFQVVDFTLNVFGNEYEVTHDTRITKDGRQFVIGGDGFIKHDYELV